MAERAGKWWTQSDTTRSGSRRRTLDTLSDRRVVSHAGAPAGDEERRSRHRDLTTLRSRDVLSAFRQNLTSSHRRRVQLVSSPPFHARAIAPTRVGERLGEAYSDAV